MERDALFSSLVENYRQILWDCGLDEPDDIEDTPGLLLLADAIDALVYVRDTTHDVEVHARVVDALQVLYAVERTINNV